MTGPILEELDKDNQITENKYNKGERKRRAWRYSITFMAMESSGTMWPVITRSQLFVKTSRDI